MSEASFLVCSMARIFSLSIYISVSGCTSCRKCFYVYLNIRPMRYNVQRTNVTGSKNGHNTAYVEHVFARPMLASYYIVYYRTTKRNHKKKLQYLTLVTQPSQPHSSPSPLHSSHSLLTHPHSRTLTPHT